MPLSTNFTDAEFEYIREICRISNKSDRKAELTGKLDSLNAAEVTATQRDIEQWKRAEYGTEKSKGGIKGTDFSTTRNRNYITNKVRERLSYPLIDFPDEGSPDYGFLTVPNWISADDRDDYST